MSALLSKCISTNSCVYNSGLSGGLDRVATEFRSEYFHHRSPTHFNMSLSPSPSASGGMNDPLAPPAPSFTRDRAFSIISNPGEPFGAASRLEHSSHPSSAQRFNLEGMRPRGLSVVQGPPLSIDDFAIPDPFDRTSSDDESENQRTEAGSRGSGSHPASAAIHSVFGRETHGVVWPQRSREGSPLGSRAPSRSASRAASRAASRRSSLIIQEPPVEGTGIWVPMLINSSMFLELPSVSDGKVHKQ
jgi:hypothetical protein